MLGGDDDGRSAAFACRPGLAIEQARFEADTTCEITSRAVQLIVVVEGSVNVSFAPGGQAMRQGSAALVPAGTRILLRCEAGARLIRIEVAQAEAAALSADFTARAWSLNLIREIATRDTAWDLMVEGLVLQGVAWLRRSRDMGERRPLWLDEATALAREQQSLDRIASVVGRHASHVAREFRRHQGVSVGEFSRRCRLELAARALVAGRDSISTIAVSAGFCDQSHFTNAFRRLFGVTPATYRLESQSRRANASGGIMNIK